MAQPDRLQLGKSVAEISVAEEDRELVADQFAAMAGEDGRQAGQARAVLLANTGGEPPDEAPVCGDGAADGGFTAASRVRSGL